MAIELIDEARANGARLLPAAKLLSICPRTYNRWKKTTTPLEDQRAFAIKPEPKHKLTEEEKVAVLNVCNSERYKNLTPHQIVPKLADEEGVYLASESTMYRVLREAKMVNPRSRAKRSASKPKQIHIATGPNQVWMWDITYLKGPIKGQHYYLYLFLDLYSRKIVGWEVWPVESAEYASSLVKKAVLSEHISYQKSPLVLHSDNGSPMKGATLMETLAKLGIEPSHSRPRVSNDNPYAESIFKTCKYMPSFPYNGFGSIAAARDWVSQFVRYYNHEHRHSGIAYLTPIQRHNGLSEGILKKRTAVYQRAKEANPMRFNRGCKAFSLPKEVWLNPTNDMEVRTTMHKYN